MGFSDRFASDLEEFRYLSSESRLATVKIVVSVFATLFLAFGVTFVLVNVAHSGGNVVPVLGMLLIVGSLWFLVFYMWLWRSAWRAKREFREFKSLHGGS